MISQRVFGIFVQRSRLLLIHLSLIYSNATHNKGIGMLNFTKGIRFTVLASIICFIPMTSLAATSFLDTDKPFIVIEDENDRAQAWGTCAAAYDLMSMMQAKASPAYSKQMSDLSNGATLALFMDYIMGMGSDVSSNQFSARVKMASVLQDGIPETQLTAMLSSGEQLQHNTTWINLITGTINLCMSNLETQQELIRF
jgi:hypothetical protein